ncbi:MAG: hypothetical protein FJ225_08905 [Lentisphaerae bacterium]|nr:hypothetical protein [Lentisphaerota bacterium]
MLACSLLRSKRVPARVRAGYALYTWGRVPRRLDARHEGRAVLAAISNRMK